MISNEMEELRESLDAMSEEDVREEFFLILCEMDEYSFDEELLNVYLDALERKARTPKPPDPPADPR